jgi:multiple sugar transport system permease protein
MGSSEPLRRLYLMKHRRSPGAFALPGIGFLIVFAMYPLYQLLVMSVSRVTSADILSAWSGAGLSNFRADVTVPDFPAALGHTLVLVAVILVVGLAGGTVAALAMRSDTWAVKAVLGLMVFAWALPAVVVGNLWRLLLGGRGPVNALLGWSHLAPGPVPWLVQGQLALLSLSLVSAWTVLPFSTLVLRAAIGDVPQDQLEAAALDGAGAVGRFRNVVLPHIRPTVSVLAVLIVVNGFRTFDLTYVMTSGGPGTATSTLPFLAYRQAFEGFEYGLGAATAVLSLGAVLVLAVLGRIVGMAGAARP